MKIENRRSLCSCVFEWLYELRIAIFFQVNLLGYNHKLRILLETIVEEIATFRVKTDRFSVIKVLFKALLICYLVNSSLPFKSSARGIQNINYCIIVPSHILLILLATRLVFHNYLPNKFTPLNIYLIYF
jgi:hypothetical protein